MPRTVLFVGGTGVISSACVRRCLEAGHEVAVLNRRRTSTRPLAKDVEVLQADVRDDDAADRALQGRSFDAVADFVAFVPDHLASAVARFAGRVGQYVFISSASAYAKPVMHLPITESTPLANPFWSYSRDKIACEELLIEAWRAHGFPATIVRPSHTYDQTLIPFEGGSTVLDRMVRGEPVVVHGDGTSLWVLTHQDDFARAFVPLLANAQVLGESVQIMGDEVLSWNQIYSTMADALGVEPRLVHVASETIARAIPEWGPSLLGDKAHSVIFDCTKLKRLVPGWTATIPFRDGAAAIAEWYLADASRRRVERELDERISALVATHA